MLEEKCDVKCTLAHRCILLYYIKIKIKMASTVKAEHPTSVEMVLIDEQVNALIYSSDICFTI